MPIPQRSATRGPEAASPVFSDLGEAALVLGFGERIDDGLNARVLACWRALGAAALPGVIDLVPAYTTLTVVFDPAAWERESLAARVQAILARTGAAEAGCSRCVEIPVCYEEDFAPDLAAVCAHTGLAPEEVVRRHGRCAYRVHFLGFTPGFPYLGGLDPALATPRRATPRTAVAAGSVAIGGAQTGVYPQSAPGGWQIIGRTPLVLFDVRRDPACLLAPGDTVRFAPIDSREFARLVQDHQRA